MDVYEGLEQVLETVEQHRVPDVSPLLSSNIFVAKIVDSTANRQRFVGLDGASEYMTYLRDGGAPLQVYGISPTTDERKELVTIPLLFATEKGKNTPASEDNRLLKQTIAEIFHLCAQFKNGIYYSANGRNLLASFKFLEPVIDAVVKEIAIAARFEMQFTTEVFSLDDQEKLYIEVYIQRHSDAVESIDVGKVEVYGTTYAVVAVNFKEEMEFFPQDVNKIRAEVQAMFSDSTSKLIVMSEYGEPTSLGSGIQRIDAGHNLDIPGIVILGE